MVTKEMWEGRFVDNELTAKYFKICSLVHDGKGEKHHILPRSMWPEYAFCKWNIVKLSYQDHYTVHELLANMCLQIRDKAKMLRAWRMMATKDGVVLDLETFVRMREEFVKSITGENNHNYGITGEDHPNYGIKRSKETLERMSISAKARPDNLMMLGKKGPLHPSYGRKATSEERAKMSAVHKGRKMPEHVKKILMEAKKNYTYTDEARANMSRSAKARVRTQDEFDKQAESRSKFSFQALDMVTGQVVATYARISDVRDAGFTESQVHHVISGRKKSHKGFKWCKIPKLPIPAKPTESPK